MVNLNKIDSSISTNPSSKHFFNKPPKWSFGIVKLLLTVLMPLLLNMPDIHLNVYIVNFVF